MMITLSESLFVSYESFLITHEYAHYVAFFNLITMGAIYITYAITRLGPLQTIVLLLAIRIITFCILSFLLSINGNSGHHGTSSQHGWCMQLLHHSYFLYLHKKIQYIKLKMFICVTSTQNYDLIDIIKAPSYISDNKRIAWRIYKSI